MSTELDFTNLLEARLRDAPPLRPTLLGDVFAQTRTIPQRRHRWPLHFLEGGTARLADVSARDAVPTAVPETNGPALSRGFTMFSAVKFVVASVIVALFGGFLLTGILTAPHGDEMAPAALTESPSTVTNDEILPDVTLTVEEVGPGVYRVTSDGMRDLASVEAADIVAGHDGGIWLLREDGFLRLGSDGSHAWPTGSGPEGEFFEVAPDGTMWAFTDASALRSTDGEEWTVQPPCPDGSTDCQRLTGGHDGTVWTSWSEGSGSDDEVRYQVGHLGPTGWQELGGDLSADLGFDRSFSTDAGDLYRLAFRYLPVLQRYDDGVWQEEGSGFNVDVGPDGTVWADVMNGVGDPALPDDQVGLARLAGGEWELWTSADILPDIRFGWRFYGYQFDVAPDGSLWFSLWRGADDSDYWNLDSWECDGLARFDGETLDRFLPSRCLSMDIADDGSVWVLAADEGALAPREGGFPDDQTWDLYVVTDEAVAASTTSVRTDILPGVTLTVEEVEPGVLRVLNDGYRDPTTPSVASRCYPGWRTLFVGDNGHIWRTTLSGGGGGNFWLYRVGQEGKWYVDELSNNFWETQVESGPEGRLWTFAEGGPLVFDEGAWVPTDLHVGGRVYDLAVQADGTVWVLSGFALHWTGEDSVGSSSWVDVYDNRDYPAVSLVSVTDDGVVWLMTEPDGRGVISLLRFDGTDWQVFPATDGSGGWLGLSFGVAPDGGALWAPGDRLRQHQSLARLDEEGWTTFTAADGVGTWGGQPSDWDAPYDMLRVAPDGSVWVNATVDSWRYWGDGLARFDGDAWQPFLSGTCVSDFDIAPDGSVWVVALDTQRRELGTYVITPEAVAATE